MMKIASRCSIIRAALPAAVLLAATLYPPAVFTALPPRPILATAAAPEPVRRLIDRSCRDCHSDNTRWPWYSAFPPASWIVGRDVARGRAAMNLSQWELYSRPSRLAFLAALASIGTNPSMPPRPYCFLHPGACPTTAQRAAIASWAREQFRRLNSETTAAGAPK